MRAGHLIPVDGVVAKVVKVTRVAPGRLRVLYRPADEGQSRQASAGILPVRDNQDVLCVRVADWRAAQRERGAGTT
ncbi:hypothetical protein [Nonomuraea rubra]|uniref:hypothetical protein n=1 Tax=Nonomuraea rubra TaxID=46180 RepID=UPI0033D1FDDD